MNEIREFFNRSFGRIRAIEHKGNIYFFGIEIASILGYDNKDRALFTHCSLMLPLEIEEQIGIDQEGNPSIEKKKVYIIPVSNVCRLASCSCLSVSRVRNFEFWLFNEVLPTIRGTAQSYSEVVSKSKQTEDIVETVIKNFATQMHAVTGEAVKITIKVIDSNESAHSGEEKKRKKKVQRESNLYEDMAKAL